MHQHTIFIVCGPTAAGKTSFAIRLANYLNTDIISADSRQCFKELNIGVAKPSAEELASVHHYFINSYSIHQTVNAAVFEDYALAAAGKIFNEHLCAVMVGGTGLYIKAFCEGLDEIPAIDPNIRSKVAADYQQKGMAYMQSQLAEKDPDFWKAAEQQNPQRIMRALEVILSTGQSIANFRTGNKEQRPFNIFKIGLELPREQLYAQINARVDQMMQHGLAEEVYGLLPVRHINALQTVGYRELFDYFDGNVSIDEAIQNMKTNTRHYAKRQLTWFKRDPGISWVNAADTTAVERVINDIKTSSNYVRE